MKSPTHNLQSRWGFHPCDYLLFRKLKTLHRCYWQTLYDFHRWHRWWRKEKRVGPEPAVCPLFVTNAVWYKQVRCQGVAGCKVYPKTVTDQGIVELYRQGRRPQPDPVAAFDSETVATIEILYDNVVAYLQE